MLSSASWTNCLHRPFRRRLCDLKQTKIIGLDIGFQVFRIIICPGNYLNEISCSGLSSSDGMERRTCHGTGPGTGERCVCVCVCVRVCLCAELCGESSRSIDFLGAFLFQFTFIGFTGREAGEREKKMEIDGEEEKALEKDVKLEIVEDLSGRANKFEIPGGSTRSYHLCRKSSVTGNPNRPFYQSSFSGKWREERRGLGKALLFLPCPSPPFFAPGKKREN